MALVVGSVSAQTMIVGNDEKPGWDANGKSILREPGHDTLSIIDMSKPEALRIVATIPLMNSIVGPPAISRSRRPATSRWWPIRHDPEHDGAGWKLVPDNKLYVIDLKANPPKLVGTVTVGKQPSGLAIAPGGKLALVANRADDTISVLAIDGKEVKVTDTVASARRRTRSRGRDHARRQARAGRQVRGQQGGAAGDRRRQGHLRQARPAGRDLPVQRRDHARTASSR